MAAYKDRVRADLDRWITAGLIAGTQRQAILDTIPETRRIDAATALAWIGGALLGVSVIAFVAANWDGLPRIARFALILAAFTITAGAGAWAAKRERPLMSNIALTVAALIFAAAIGLTGQIFDIAGEPKTALRGAGVAALALALAGRSTGAAIAALLLFGIADFQTFDFLGAHSFDIWSIVVAPIGLVLALLWRSTPLAHAGCAAGLIALWRVASENEANAAIYLVFSIVLFGCTALARYNRARDHEHAGVFYGWAALGALSFFAIAGLATNAEPSASYWDIPHRLAWLVASGAAIALGRFDRHIMLTATGVISLMLAITVILVDLGFDLLAAAAVFFVGAFGALVAGLMLRRAKS